MKHTKKQGNTTTSGKEGEGKTKKLRNSVKFPALNKGVNLSSRKDYIEPEYINGVYDKHGNELIRPLTEEEKEFLNQYYEEAVVTNFYHDPELKRLNRQKRAIIEDDVVRLLQAELKELKVDKETNRQRIKEIKEIITITKKQNEETYADDLELIEEELSELRHKKLLYPDKEDHKRFYTENNSRNSCIFNKARTMNRLMFLESDEYDQHLAKYVDEFKEQDKYINELERTKYEKEEERLREVLREEKELKRKKNLGNSTKNRDES